jgi:putative hydrolase of the HAD superfamily
MDRYGLKAEECVFIDDRPENIEAAKALGMEGIVFENYEQASEELEKVATY